MFFMKLEDIWRKPDQIMMTKGMKNVCFYIDNVWSESYPSSVKHFDSLLRGKGEITLTLILLRQW